MSSPSGRDQKIFQRVNNHCSPHSMEGQTEAQKDEVTPAVAEPRVAPRNPNGPFNASDKAKVARWACPILGNCLHMWASQFLPRFQQDTVLLPTFRATQSRDHTARQCLGASCPSFGTHPGSGTSPLCPCSWLPLRHLHAKGQEEGGFTAGPASPRAPSTPSLPPLHVPDVAGTAGSAQCGNYLLPHPGRLSPVPSRGWMFSS